MECLIAPMSSITQWASMKASERIFNESHCIVDENTINRPWWPALALTLGGCANHPEPGDVTGVSTFEIVQQIRCETRKAVIDSVFEYLSKSPDVDPYSREIGSLIYQE